MYIRIIMTTAPFVCISYLPRRFVCVIMQTKSHVKRILKKLLLLEYVFFSLAVLPIYNRAEKRFNEKNNEYWLLTNAFERDSIPPTYKINWLLKAMEVPHEYADEPEHCEYRMLLLLSFTNRRQAYCAAHSDLNGTTQSIHPACFKKSASLNRRDFCMYGRCGHDRIP